MVKSLPLPQSLAYHNRGKLIIKMSRGARKDGKANLIFHLPINYPPSCIFAPSHQPPLALLTRSHALRFVLVHYPQEKQVEEAGKLIRLYKVNPAKYGNRINTDGRSVVMVVILDELSSDQSYCRLPGTSSAKDAILETMETRLPQTLVHYL